MVSIEERVSRLEGEYPHLATKADIAELRGELKGSLQSMRWMLGLVGAGLAALSVILKFVA